ncbi:MAG: PAC2 family protein [Desulfosarcinaceae bacterium]|nr:PAC2 family protein [Desulfosarcinaceae bacterium]
MNAMDSDTIGFRMLDTPPLTTPLCIVAFDGWGDALNVSTALVEYLLRVTSAAPLAEIETDPFFNFDQLRPTVRIRQGRLETITPPEAKFYYAASPEVGKPDLIFFRGEEPTQNWHRFVACFMDICGRFGEATLFSVGGLYDRVLHTEALFSAIYTSGALLAKLPGRVQPATYTGPGAIHTLLHAEARRRGMPALSLWAHCPHYIQNTTHFGLVAELVRMVAAFSDYTLDAEPLLTRWKKIERQIDALAEESEEVREVIDGLRQERRQGDSSPGDRPQQMDTKIVRLEDFRGDR